MKAHGRILPDNEDKSKMDIIKSPSKINIIKKNVSICGFPSASLLTSNMSPSEFMEDLLTKGIYSCYPQKEDVKQYLGTLFAIKGIENYEKEEKRRGYENYSQYIEDTCKLQFDKTHYVNKRYRASTGTETTATAGIVFPIGITIVWKMPVPSLPDGTENEVIKNKEGDDIYIHKSRTFNLLDREDVISLLRDYAQKRMIDRNQLVISEILQNLENAKPFTTTNHIFNILKLLQVNTAYIVDGSCSMFKGEHEKIILPPNVGYGGRKRKTRKSKKSKKHVRKSHKIKLI